MSDLDAFMRHVASERAVVRLANGRTARLIAWKPRDKRRTVRVEYPSTRRVTLPTSAVVAIEDDDGTIPLPLPEETHDV